jgi:hypothetical protein
MEVTGGNRRKNQGTWKTDQQNLPNLNVKRKRMAVGGVCDLCIILKIVTGLEAWLKPKVPA